MGGSALDEINMKKLCLILFVLFCGICISSPLYNSFNSGELSPFLMYRVDLQKRVMGVEIMENMYTRPQGVVMRRPGTKYIGEVNDSNEKVRLIPFEYSTTDTYILMFNNEKIGFFGDAGN